MESVEKSTLAGGGTWTAGKTGNAVNLDGTNDYLALPAGIVGKLDDFTISTWVRLDTVSTWTRLFDFGSGTGINMFLTPSSSTGGMRFAITTQGYTEEQQINSSTRLATRAWKHVAVTRDGNLAILYVDGVEVGRNANMTIAPADLGNTTKNYLGRSQYSNNPYLDGRLDNFRIYNRALSAAEIKSQYSSGN